MRNWWLGTASLMVIACAGGAMAADAEVSVDPVTVIATRSEKAASEVPATVSVITSADIEESLAADIKDMVRYEPGVSVRSSPARFGAALGTTGRDGNSGFNIRGLEGNRVLMQVDGIRIPDGFVFGAQAVGRGDYGDLDLLKSVEILRGPASALYGSDGVAGAVSFTTKDPTDVLQDGKAWAFQGKGAYASADDSWAEGVVAAGRQGRLSGLLAYTHRDGHEQETQGYANTANTDRTTANPQDTTSNDLLGKLVFDLSDKNRFRLIVEHFDRDVDTNVLSAIAKPPLAATSVLSLKTHDETGRDRVSIDQRYEQDGGWFQKATWNLYYQKSETSQFSAEDRNVSADRTRLNTFDNKVWGAGFELDSSLETGAVTHLLTYGADISKTRQEGVRSGTVPPAGETYPTRAFPNTDYTLGGAFLQDEIGLLDGRLKLYPAVRLDAYDLKPHADATLPAFTPASQSDSRVSPKIGAVFKLNDQVGLFLNYAEGFKAPAPSQVNNAFVNLIQNYRSIPNPNLKPETSETVEGGVRFKGETLGGGGKWSLNLTAFSGKYANFIDQVQISGSFSPTDPGVFQVVNIGQVKISGAELQGRVQLDNGFGGQLAASYAHGSARTGAVSSPLDSIDPIKVTAGVTYRDRTGRFGGMFAVTHSDGKSPSRIAAVCTGGCEVPDAFTVLDATAYWNITDEVRINAGAFNLSDEKYAWWNDVRGVSATSPSVDAYTQPGRNYAVALTVKF
jgi:hemoglobin/transferrin/lactoferrin receptor protein